MTSALLLLLQRSGYPSVLRQTGASTDGELRFDKHVSAITSPPRGWDNITFLRPSHQLVLVPSVSRLLLAGCKSDVPQIEARSGRENLHQARISISCARSTRGFLPAGQFTLSSHFIRFFFRFDACCACSFF